MHRRHTSLPSQWLFTDERLGEDLWTALGTLPRGSGVVIRHHDAPERSELVRRIRLVGRTRGLLILDEAKGEVARVHNAAELRRALLARRALIFLSPLYATRSHPDLPPLPRMRTAALIRLAKRPVFALGGMDSKKYRDVQPLGFAGWGGIDGWLRT